MRIVGVLPKGFHLYLGPGVIVPASISGTRARSPTTTSAFRGRIVIARLKDGVSLETVRAAP